MKSYYPVPFILLTLLLGSCSKDNQSNGTSDPSSFRVKTRIYVDTTEQDTAFTSAYFYTDGKAIEVRNQTPGQPEYVENIVYTADQVIDDVSTQVGGVFLRFTYFLNQDGLATEVITVEFGPPGDTAHMHHDWYKYDNGYPVEVKTDELGDTATSTYVITNGNRSSTTYTRSSQPGVVVTTTYE